MKDSYTAYIPTCRAVMAKLATQSAAPWVIETRDSRGCRAWLARDSHHNIQSDPEIAVHFEREDDARAMVGMLHTIARPHQKECWRYSMPVPASELPKQGAQPGGEYKLWQRRCNKYKLDHVKAQQARDERLADEKRERETLERAAATRAKWLGAHPEHPDNNRPPKP